MSVKAKGRANEKKDRAVLTTSIRTSDIPRLEQLAKRLGMTRVEYLSRVLSRDEKKNTDVLATELLTVGE